MNADSTPRLPPVIDYPNGIHCIDTLQERAGLACCYLLRRGDDLAFVEAGTAHGVPRLLALLDARGIARERVRYVIPTHVHLRRRRRRAASCRRRSSSCTHAARAT